MREDHRGARSRERLARTTTRSLRLRPSLRIVDPVSVSSTVRPENGSGLAKLKPKSMSCLIPTAASAVATEVDP